MIKKSDWDSFKVSLADSYTSQANSMATLFRNGGYNRIAELRFVVLTRYVKVIDLQNVKADEVQIESKFKDYDEASIQNAIDRINLIIGTTFNIPIVTDPFTVDDNFKVNWLMDETILSDETILID